MIVHVIYRLLYAEHLAISLLVVHDCMFQVHSVIPVQQVPEVVRVIQVIPVQPAYQAVVENVMPAVQVKQCVF